VPAPVDAVFGKDSPFRPRGAGTYLGATPLGPIPMPMGSWLLVVAADGFVPMRVPVQVARGAAVERDLTLWRREELGEGEIVLPEGPFHFQGDPGNPSSMTYREPLVRDVAMSRFRVTCAEYAAFLNALPPAQAAAAAPRESASAASWWPGPPWDFRGAKRPGECVADWEAEWPVIGISWTDAMRFAAWRRAQDGRAWVLPTEEEWEKAARGADRRAYVCGPYLDDRWACLNRSFPDGPRVVPVGAYPHDETPYGVRGMAGTCEDYGVTTPGPLYSHWRIMRGGAWTHTAARARNSWRHGDIPAAVTRFNGCRLARLLVLR
jgi:serine/threonine-protein kinase